MAAVIPQRIVFGRFGTLLAVLASVVLSACVTPVPSQVSHVMVGGRVVSEASGDVQLVRAGQTVSVQPGQGVEVGDEIITGPGAQAVLVLENAHVEVIVLENSRIRISSVFVDIGEVIVRIVKKLEDAFEVQSEYATAGAESTEFLVSVRPDRSYRCVALEGKVRVRSPGGVWQPTSLGRGEEVTGRSGVSPVQRRLAREEYNELIERVNAIERVFRSSALRLIVPDVAGLMEDEARTLMRGEGLAVGDVKRSVTGGARIGEVLTQSPSAGMRLAPGNAVQLEVEAEPTTVPGVTGMQRREAETMLSRARLNLKDVHGEITGRHPEGEVFRQDPPPRSRVPVNSDVVIWVEAASVVVPQVRGEHIENARRLLQNAGLAVGQIGGEMSGQVAAEAVLSQNPAPGTRLPPGSVVQLVVELPSVVVPSLERLQRQQAMEVLMNSDLRVGRVDSRLMEGARDGTVLEQSVVANRRVPPGTTVNLVVAEQAVRVPQLVRQNRHLAERALRDSGLRVGQVSQRAANQTSGTVVEQRPSAGMLVRPGSVVSFSVASSCTVPNLIRSNYDQAMQLLRSAQLNGRVVDRERYAPDIVFGQTPQAGAQVDCGSTVNLRLGSSLG